MNWGKVVLDEIWLTWPQGLAEWASFPRCLSSGQNINPGSLAQYTFIILLYYPPSCEARCLLCIHTRMQVEGITTMKNFTVFHQHALLNFSRFFSLHNLKDQLFHYFSIIDWVLWQLASSSGLFPNSLGLHDLTITPKSSKIIYTR